MLLSSGSLMSISHSSKLLFILFVRSSGKVTSLTRACGWFLFFRDADTLPVINLITLKALKINAN